jgi:hypothetical protein
MRARSTIPLAVLVAVLATAANAQDAPRASASTPAGTWIGAGVGGGWTRLTCAICRTDRNLGPSGHLRFGTTLRPGFLLGAEVDGWTRSDNDIRSIVGAGAIATYLYPNPAGGLFLKGGIGYVRYSVDSGNLGTNLLGLLIGAGFEFPVAPGLNVTNYVSLLASSFGSLRSERSTVANDVSISLLQFGIGLTKY